jgi:hypothetical protein
MTAKFFIGNSIKPRDKIISWHFSKFLKKSLKVLIPIYINGKQHLCQDFGSLVSDSRCENVFFCWKLDLINIFVKICVSVYYWKPEVLIKFYVFCFLWCSTCKNCINVIHQSMRINVSYNIYVLNNPQKLQNIEKILKKP